MSPSERQPAWEAEQARREDWNADYRSLSTNSAEQKATNLSHTSSASFVDTKSTENRTESAFLPRNWQQDDYHSVDGGDSISESLDTDSNASSSPYSSSH